MSGVKMIKLSKTKWGVYYFHDYVPSKIWGSYHDLDSVEDSKKIIDFKNFDEECIELYSTELMQVISYLSNNVMNSFVKNLALVSVPSSKVDKDSPINKCINMIEEWFDDGIISSNFNCNKKIYK